MERCEEEGNGGGERERACAAGGRKKVVCQKICHQAEGKASDTESIFL